MTAKGIFSCFLFFIQLLALGQSKEIASGQTEEYKLLADSFYNVENWEQARLNYEYALSTLGANSDVLLKHAIHRKMADAFRMAGKFELAMDHYFIALQAFKRLNAQQEIMETLKQISIHLSSTDPLAAISYADSALMYARQSFPNDSMQIVQYLFQLADRHRTAIKYEESVVRYMEVLDLLENLPVTDSFLLFNTHFRLGGVLCRLDRREESLKQYEIAEELLLDKYDQDEKLLRNFYQDVAFLLEDMGDFGQALNYRKRYCAYFMDRGDSTSFQVSRAMNNLGLTHERRGEYQEALHWYRKVLENNRRIYGATSIYTAFPMNNVGNIYKHLGQYEKGLPLLKEAHKIFRDYFSEDHVYPANVSSNIGNTYNLMGRPKQALSYNMAALQIRREKLGPYHEDLARDYQLIGDIYVNLQSFADAVHYYDSAIYATKYKADVGFEAVISHHRLYQAMEKKARAYQLWYEQSDDWETLRKAFVQYREIDDLTNFVRSSYKSEGSKRFLLRKRRAIYEDAVAVMTTLYERTLDTFYFNEAFRFSEKTRSILLYEALLSSQVQDFAGIPSELKSEIASLRQQTAELEKQFFEGEHEKKSDAELANTLERQLFASRNDYQKLMRQVASNYPAYFNLKYQLDTRSMEEAQNLLSDDQVFLEYLIGQDRITVFIITKENKYLFHFPLDFPLRLWIQELRQSIYGYTLSPQKSPELFDSLQSLYTDRACAIYDKLLRPIEPYLVNKSTLIISPDQELNYLPFATLLDQKPENPLNFKDYPYLLRRFALHYVPSITLWHEMQKRNSQFVHSKILAFAPAFDPVTNYSSIDATRSSLGMLKYNEQEVAKIGDAFAVESYVGKQAKLDEFLVKAPDYSILHLATHGKANDKEGDYSYLAFSNNSGTSDPSLFYAADIYNLNLNAEMVVLSACETGIGELQKGEGIISLARAFSYAGAKSIVTTLWAVNDQSTSDLMLLFYENLKNKISKAKSLQQAKLDYLDQVMDPIEGHPFYWAGIISLGASNAVDIPTSLRGFNIAFVIGLVMAFSLLIVQLSKRIFKRSHK